jgi:hypothetical protein
MLVLLRGVMFFYLGIFLKNIVPYRCLRWRRVLTWEIENSHVLFATSPQTCPHLVRYY